MAKFVYRMQNILDIKNKLEIQAKNSYAVARMRLNKEEEKLDGLFAQKKAYEDAYRQQLSGSIDVRQINICKNAIELSKNMIKKQLVEVKVASLNLEAAQKRLGEIMKERKIQEKLREKAYEEFLQELNDQEKKEIDELVSFRFEQEEEKKSNKLVIILVTVLIILIWLAIFVLLVKLDVGGFGSKVLRPVLKDVPVINKILPDASNEEIGMDSKYPYTTLSEAIARIEELENENLALNEAAATDAETIANLTSEVARLTPFETYQKNYEELKRQFDEQVVFGNDYTGNYAADPETYKTWYESIDPENAAVIYQQVLEKQASSQIITDLAATYSKMKAAQAASILEEMTGDEEKVASILASMSAAKAADILQNMTSTYAAKITLLMYPSPYTMEEYRENRIQESQGKNPVGNPDGTHDGSNAPR